MRRPDGPTLATFVAVGALSAVGCQGGSKTASTATSGSPTAAAASGRASSTGSPASAQAGTVPTDFSALYTQVRPSIVEITTAVQSGGFSGQQQGLGSGIVLDADGNILTNDHVISGSQTVTITFADESTAQGTVVGTDGGNDIAVVKTSADKRELHPAKLGDSGVVKVGNVVAAGGNPFGLEGSFTTGVVSGLDRTLPSDTSTNGRPLRGLIQTDALWTLSLATAREGSIREEPQARVLCRHRL